MAAIEFQMSVAFPCMVDRVPVCDFGEEWAWIFGQGVESEAVESKKEKLVLLVGSCDGGWGCLVLTYPAKAIAVNEVTMAKRPSTPSLDDSMMNIYSRISRK
jgi:hypothetical protein